ncbi:cytochrome P450 [Phyllosticta capitalensis]
MSTIVYLILLYLSYLAVKRLVFSPIARFPGPKLAALTRWYELFYDAILPGRFNWQVDKLHEQYGPVVRINPEELHIQDSDYFDEFYERGAKCTRWDGTNGRFSGRGAPQAIPSTLDNELHRIRRAAINPLFSKRSIYDIEPMLHEKLELACEHLTRHAQDGTPINIVDVWAAMGADIITQYGWGKALDALKSEDCKQNLHGAILAAGRASQFFIQFISLQNVLRLIPFKWLKYIQPGQAGLIDYRERVAAHLPTLLPCGHPEYKDPKEDATPITRHNHPVVFSALLQSKLSEADKDTQRLAAEVGNLVGAGSETTAWGLSVGTYYIIANPRITHRLRQELMTLVPELPIPPTSSSAELSPAIPPLRVLERGPYLSACIKESLRHSLGVASRSPRVYEHDLRYRDWVIPAGTPVSMTYYDVCMDKRVFEQPERFWPERWLNEGEVEEDDAAKEIRQRGKALHNGEPLERYWVIFGKGDRNCLGLTLAMAELYLGLGTLFRKYDLELFETDESDVKMAHDFFVAAPKLDSKGVRVKLRELQG